MNRPDALTAIPWLQLILRSIFENGSISLVWKYIHPDTQAHLIDHLFPDSRPTIEELSAAVVNFFRTNLAGYDHETWGTFSVPELVGPGLEEYIVIRNESQARELRAGTPVEGYRLTMEHAPEIDPDHAAGWYLVGIKGEILK